MKKLVWAAAGIALMLSVTPMLIMLMVVITTPAVATDLVERSCAYQPAGASNEDAGMSRRPVAAGQLRVIAANTLRTLPTRLFADDLDTLTKTGPDFVTLDEVATRTPAQLHVAGYHTWRAATEAGAKDVAVLWRTDRWRLTARGTQLLQDSRQVAGSGTAAWVTLRHTSTGATISVVSLHEPQAPYRPVRHRLYGSGTARLRSLVTRLERSGPLLLGGDLNISRRLAADRRDPAPPFATLAPTNTIATYATLGRPPRGWATADIRRRTIDYVFYHRDGTLRPLREDTIDTHAGHAALWVDFAMPTGGNAGTGASATPTAPVAAGSREGGLGFNLPPPGKPRLASLHTAAAPIPPTIKTDYLRGAAKYKIPWALLAGIGMEETDHGRNDHTSSAGAQGLMQFMPATWARYGVDGDGDGRAVITDHADSAMSAANYLTASGVAQGPAGVRRALLAYNHATWYVNDILYYAARYGGGTVLGDPTDCGPAGADATGNPALPAMTGPRIAGLLSWARGQLGEPYVYGANGPNQWDCSSFSRGAYAHIGITLPRTAQAQRDWLAAGNGYRVRLGQERPGDLVFTNTYLGPNRVGHVMIVSNPAVHASIEAVGSHVQDDRYTRYAHHPIFEIWRVGNIADHLATGN